MPHRYTIKELHEMSDYEFLSLLVKDREKTTTNVYSPLNRRLSHIRSKLDSCQYLTQTKELREDEILKNKRLRFL